jgi:hypothetical protein
VGDGRRGGRGARDDDRLQRERAELEFARIVAFLAASIPVALVSPTAAQIMLLTVFLAGRRVGDIVAQQGGAASPRGR